MDVMAKLDQASHLELLHGAWRASPGLLLAWLKRLGVGRGHLVPET